LHKIFLDAQKIATSASSRSAYSPQDVNYEFIKALVATAVAQVAQIEVRTIHSKITIDQAGSGDELNLQSYKCKIAPVNFAKNAKPQSSMVLIKNDEIDFESLTGRAVSVNEGAGREVVGVKKESATLKITFQDSAAIADFYNGEAQKRGVVVTLAGATSVLRGSGRGCAIV